MKLESNTKLFIIIQARMTSSRLPKKVLLPLCGKTVLEVMLDRLEQWKDNIIIATTDDGSEKDITDLCTKLGIRYFRGSTYNVLSRYYKSALQYGAENNDIIVLIDPELLQKTLALYLDGDYDYVSNRINRTVPVGLDVEVFNFEILKESYLNASMAYEKEHVTPYIYITQKDKFKIGSFEESKNCAHYRLTLDEEDDYIAIKEIYKKFNNKIHFSYKELINMLELNPYIYQINHHVSQKKVIN